jgi:cytochrome c peroxidase
MIDRLLLALLVLMLGSTAMALPQPGAEHLVTQKDRSFSVQDIRIAAGDRLIFSNEDEFPHQISIKGPGVAFNSSLQRTGEMLSVLFPEPGSAQVRCGIHPRMRLTVQVD